MAKVVVITAINENFRRAGIVFSRTPKEIPVEFFAAAENKGKLDLIKGDPGLVVYEKEVADPELELESKDDGKADSAETAKKKK